MCLCKCIIISYVFRDSEPYDETTYPVANLPKTADEEEASGSADHEMAQAVESIQAGAHNAQ